jgi:broad specificity phosphatase PhoE
MGQSDIPLNATGRKQAEEIGKKLRDVHFTAAFSSNMLRARRTAELALLEKKIAVQTTKALRERHFGRLEGKSWANQDKDLQMLWDKLANLTDQERKIFNLEKAENDEDMMRRFIPFIREIAVAYEGKNILIVTHGGIMRVFLKHIGWLEEDKPFSVEIKNTSYIKLESDGVDFFVKDTFGVEKKSPS